MAESKILVVDDETEMLVSCRKILQSKARSIVTTESGQQALSLMEKTQFDLVVCDLRLPDIDGLDLLRKSRVIAPQSVFVFITAYGTVDMAVEAMKAGAFNFIEKPFTFDRLLDVVDGALEFRKSIALVDSEPSADELTQFDNIVGTSPIMKEIYETIRRVAPTDTNVMIIGESGTGKELVAQGIHNHSRRKAMRFVPVNCGALPENIFESELFGHEKGSFTGAHSRKTGLVEFANGGTFFLDEVCALSPVLQVKLLRMVQDRKIRRVGGEKLIDVDVRIISATNVDPDRALKDNILREDLYYRLKVITIKMPPLRERLEDIPLLCYHFLRKYIKLNPGKKVKGISPESVILLQNYSWPGNVRELQNVIESALALSKGEWITPEDLPDSIDGQKRVIKGLFKEPIKDAKNKLISSFEREYLITVLKDQDWNISKAAKFCGVDRRTLQRMLRRHHINIDDRLQQGGTLAAPETA